MTDETPQGRMDAFIARQPILDAQLRVKGYELLFRSGLVDAFDSPDPDRASSKVISDSLFLAGVETLTAGRPAFINVTRELLVKDLVGVLPPTSTVLEILKSVPPDDDVLAACRHLRENGFRIALDDFTPDRSREALLSVADIVKVDVLACGNRARQTVARKLRGSGITLLAKKVETHDIFGETRDLGFGLFQGFFFARPATLTCRDISGSRHNYIRILHELHQPDLDLGRIETLIEEELALSYKLLRFLNSAYFGRRNEVRSIHHALLLLGERQVRNWASIMALAGMASDKPSELVNEAVFRSRFCELIAAPAGLGAQAADLFLVGMFSVLDAILDRPLETILAEIPVAEDTRAALLGSPGPMRDVLDILLAYSAGNWDGIRHPAERLGLDESEIPRCFMSAIRICVGGGFDPRESKAA